MKVLVIAIGQKLPDWANTACEDYLRRFPKDWNVEVKALKAEDRNTNTTEKIMQAEAERIRSAIPKNSVLVILDERGVDLTSVKLASKLNSWNDQGRTVVFVIGGADGLDKHLKAEGELMLRLSSLTLPHAMVRVLILEQIYRSWSLLHNHPYHRA